MVDLFTLKSELESYEHTSTADELRTFLRSNVWQDMKSELQVHLLNRWEALEKMDDHISASVIRGNIEAIRRMLDMPRDLLEYLERLNDNA